MPASSTANSQPFLGCCPIEEEVQYKCDDGTEHYAGMGDRGKPGRKVLEKRRGKRRDKTGSDGNGNYEEVIRPSAKVDR